VPLSIGVKSGEIILAVAVLSILFTALSAQLLWHYWRKVFGKGMNKITMRNV
jgi:hypothetical protein